MISNTSLVNRTNTNLPLPTQASSLTLHSFPQTATASHSLGGALLHQCPRVLVHVVVLDADAAAAVAATDDVQAVVHLTRAVEGSGIEKRDLNASYRELAKPATSCRVLSYGDGVGRFQ